MCIYYVIRRFATAVSRVTYFVSSPRPPGSHTGAKRHTGRHVGRVGRALEHSREVVGC